MIFLHIFQNILQGVVSKMEQNVLKFQKINELVNLGLIPPSEAIELVDRPRINDISKLDSSISKLEQIKYLFKQSANETEADMYYHFWKLLFEELSIKNIRNNKISKILEYSPSDEHTSSFYSRLSRSLLRDLDYDDSRRLYFSNVIENVIVSADNMPKKANSPIDHRVNNLISEIVTRIDYDRMVYEELSLGRCRVVSSKDKNKLVKAIIDRIRKVKSLNLIRYYSEYPLFAIDCACHGNKLLRQFKMSDYEEINCEIHKVWRKLYFEKHPNLDSCCRYRYVLANLYPCESERLKNFYVNKINSDSSLEEIRSTFTESKSLIGEYLPSEYFKNTIRNFIFDAPVTDITKTIPMLKAPEVMRYDKKEILYACIPLIDTHTPEQCLLDTINLCIERQNFELNYVLFKRIRLICKRFLTCKITDDNAFCFFKSVYSISRKLQINPENDYAVNDLRELEILSLLVLLSFRGNYQDINEEYLEMSIENLESGLRFLYKSYYNKIPNLRNNKHYLLANIINIVDNYEVSRFGMTKNNYVKDKAQRLTQAARSKLEAILSEISEKDICEKDSLDYLKTYRKLSKESKMNLIQIYIN